MVQSHLKTTSQRIATLIALEKNDIFMVSGLTVGIGLLSLALPLAVQTLVNIVTMGGVAQPLFVVSLMLFSLLCLSGALYLLEYYVVERIQRRIFLRAAQDIAVTAHQMPAEVYDKYNSVELMNRFFDVSTIQKATYLLLTNGLSAVMQLIIGSIVLMFYSFYFAVIVLGMLMVAAFIVYVLGHHAAKYAIAESYAKYDMVAWLQTVAKNLHIFKYSHGHQLAKSKTEQLIAQYLKSRHQHFSLLLKQNILAVVTYAVAGTSIMAFGGLLVMQGEINLGQFVAAELIIFGVLSAFISFVKKLETYYDMVAAIDKIGALEDLPRDVSRPDHVELSHPVKLIFDKVSYGYLARRNVINGLSFSIENGNSTAFLGAQGTGKSTLCDLISALRFPSEGLIYINNIDIRQLDLANLREQIGVASQIQILEESILENIRLFDEAIHISQVQAVLAGLDIATETSELPAGLDTLLSSNGSPLNASQSQLLMVARAIINKPSLLVIDGLLDELSNTQLSKALRFMANFNPACTLVILTSKVEVASHCHIIVDLASGKVGGR
jgi:putative ABC transport system ATP-binding protein